MRRLLAGITGLLLVVAVGCGSSGSKSSSSSSSSSSSKSSSSSSSSAATTTTTTSTTTTTTEPPSTAPPTTVEPNGASTPELAAQGLHDRWLANDQAGAHAFAEQAAIDILFAHPSAGANDTFQSCDGAAGTFHCAFTYEGGSADYQVHDEALFPNGITGFKVFNIQYTAD
ncbi:MAG: hypothetical protein QOE63_1052 [Acidimicrobiaceae bacterium]